MMRQLVGARIELAVGEALVLEHHRDGIGRAWRPAPRTAPAAVADGSARAVSFQPCRMVWRSVGARMSQAADRAVRDRRPRPPAAERRRPASASTLARSNRSVAYSSTPSSPAGGRPRRAARQAQRQVELGAAVVDRLEPQPSAPATREAAPARCSATPASPGTADAAQRARRVEHLDQPLERQVLVAVGGQVASPAPARAARGSSDCRDVSVRSTSVLTKKPISRRARCRCGPRSGCRSGCRCPPQPVSSAASAACSTMNRLARPSRASASRPPCSSADSANGDAVAAIARTAGRGRSVGSSSCSGRLRQRARSSTPAGAQSRSPDRSPRPAPRAATACSRRTAPAAPADRARRPGSAPRRRAQVARQRRQRPAVAGDVVQQQQQHVLVGRRARTDARAAAARWRDRSPAAPPRRERSGRLASLTVDDRKPRPRRARRPRISWRGTPERVGEDACAGSRAAPPGRRARPPAPQRRARPSAAAPAGSL